MTKIRIKLTDEQALKRGFSLTQTKRYYVPQEDWMEIKQEAILNQGVLNACENVGVEKETAPYMWLKTKNESVKVNNPYYVAPKDKEIDFTSIYKEIQKEKFVPAVKTTIGLFDRLVFSDAHIGMDPNKTGHALYEGEWNEDILMQRLDVMIEWTLANRKSSVLLIHELGDFVDGWNGETTRAGHKLPQNMDNQKMFDVGLKFKIKLVKALAPYYSKIVCVNITNCNHGGSFGYIVNSAFKECIQNMYDHVEVFNQRKFIDHYVINDRCFILCHGKDDSHMKFGMKPDLDAKTTLKIKEYIDEYKLQDYKCEFGKGDSHQMVLNYTTSKSFEYQNFGSFAPSSDWIKTNFSNSKSTFTHFNYLENQKLVNNYIF